MSSHFQKNFRKANKDFIGIKNVSLVTFNI